MAEGQKPDQEAIDDVRREARIEALQAIRNLEQLVRGDEGMGGVAAIQIGGQRSGIHRLYHRIRHGL